MDWVGRSRVDDDERESERVRERERERERAREREREREREGGRDGHVLMMTNVFHIHMYMIDN